MWCEDKGPYGAAKHGRGVLFSPCNSPSLGLLVTTWRSRKNPQHQDRMPVKATKPEPDPTSYAADEAKRTSEGTRREREVTVGQVTERVIGPSWRPPMSGPRAATSSGTALRNGAYHTGLVPLLVSVSHIARPLSFTHCLHMGDGDSSLGSLCRPESRRNTAGARAPGCVTVARYIYRSDVRTDGFPCHDTPSHDHAAVQSPAAREAPGL